MRAFAYRMKEKLEYLDVKKYGKLKSILGGFAIQ